MATRNTGLKIEKIIAIIAQSFDLRKVFVAKISDELWCFNFYWQVENQILDFQYLIYEVTLCDSRPASVADVICWEFREINHRQKLIGDPSCNFNARHRTARRRHRHSCAAPLTLAARATVAKTTKTRLREF